MRYYSSLFLLLVFTFATGILIGDNYAPISGATTRGLAIKCAALEARVELLKMRVERLELEANDVRSRVKLWMPSVDL